jgi:hypothetical protein
METNYKIGQQVKFSATIFGGKRTITNRIKFIEIIDGETIYFIGGVGQSLFERELKGREDCFRITEKELVKNIINTI